MSTGIGRRLTTGIAIFRSALKELLTNDPLRMAGATAFFTTFALPPILVILIQVFKWVVDPVKIRTELFRSLEDIVGPEAVKQITDILTSLRKLAQNPLVIIGGFIFLLFIATTLFKVIKNSLNQIWKIRPVYKRSLIKSFRGRARAIVVILIAGVLFVIGIVAEGVQAYVGAYLFEFSPALSVYFNTALNHFISIIIVTIWFSIVFRFLPDGRPSWRIAITGGIVTALLFTVGKLILHWLLSYSNLNTVYGTSASIVLLLLFVFYSSLIMYYGAAFTKVWGIFNRDPIRPLKHAIQYRIIEDVLDVKPVEDD
jgi:membrane protein